MIFIVEEKDGYIKITRQELEKLLAEVHKEGKEEGLTSYIQMDQPSITPLPYKPFETKSLYKPEWLVRPECEPIYSDKTFHNLNNKSTTNSPMINETITITGDSHSEYWNNIGTTKIEGTATNKIKGTKENK